MLCATIFSLKTECARTVASPWCARACLNLKVRFLLNAIPDESPDSYFMLFPNKVRNKTVTTTINIIILNVLSNAIRQGLKNERHRS